MHHRQNIFGAVELLKVAYLFCFDFAFMLSLKPRPFIQSFFDMEAASVVERASDPRKQGNPIEFPTE